MPRNYGDTPRQGMSLNTQYVSQGRSDLDMLVTTPYGRNQEPQSLGHPIQLLPLNSNACVLPSLGVNMLRNYGDTSRQGISPASPITTIEHGFNPTFRTPNYDFGVGDFDITGIPIHNFQSIQPELFAPHHITMPPLRSISAASMSLCYPSKVMSLCINPS